MDRKVNEFIRSQLTRQAGSPLVILPQKMADQNTRHLPKPFEKEEDSCHLRDQMRWNQYPTDIRDDEKSRIHSFLLLKFDDIPIGITPFSPIPLDGENNEDNVVPFDKQVSNN